MADSEALRDAIIALLPARSKAQETNVDERVALPWTRVSVSLPAPVTRSMARQPRTHRVLVRLLCVGANERAAWRLAEAAIDGLEGARPLAPGWQTGPLQQLNDDPVPYQDRDLKVIDTNAFPVCIALDFDLYATRIKETP